MRIVHIKTFAHDMYVMLYVHMYVCIYICIIHTHTPARALSRPSHFGWLIYVLLSGYWFERLFIFLSQQMRWWYHRVAQPLIRILLIYSHTSQSLAGYIHVFWDVNIISSWTWHQVYLKVWYKMTQGKRRIMTEGRKSTWGPTGGKDSL